VRQDKLSMMEEQAGVIMMITTEDFVSVIFVYDNWFLKVTEEAIRKRFTIHL
jgi:hypothetical protein